MADGPFLAAIVWCGRRYSYVRCGDRLTLGQRLGDIRFGSQVDMVIPERAGLRIDVNVGDRVFAGVTIVART